MKELHKVLFIFAFIFMLVGCGTEPIRSTQAPAPIPSIDPDSSTSVDTGPESNGQNNGELLVHFIDVGQGASQLLIGPSGKTMLIDAGNNDKEQLIVDYIKNQDISKIDILIGTHPDADHIGGLDAVIDNFDIGSFYMPRIQHNTKTFEDVLLAAQNKGLSIKSAKAGLTLDWEENSVVKMIAPINEYSDNNEMSAVIHLTFGETSFLFTGDIESRSEADIVSSYTNISTNVMLVSHHGSNSSTSQAFLDKVGPEYAVIQVGNNNYGHPDNEVLDRLLSRDIKIYRNDLQGDIIFTSDGQDINVNVAHWNSEQQATDTLTPVPTPEPVTTSEPTPIPTSEPTPEPTPAEKQALNVSSEISNESPTQNSSVTVTVKVSDANGNPVSGALVDLSLKYKSTKSDYSGVTDSNGVAEITFGIGRATKDYVVRGTIVASHDDHALGIDSVSFTPQ